MWLAEWRDVQVKVHPELRLLHHVPNGGDRHPVVAKKLRAMGTLPGVADYMLPVARYPHHGLYLEAKRRDGGGGLSSDQKAFRDAVMVEGYEYIRADGWNDAAAAILAYLRRPRWPRMRLISGGRGWSDR